MKRRMFSKHLFQIVVRRCKIVPKTHFGMATIKFLTESEEVYYKSKMQFVLALGEMNHAQ